MSEKKYYVGNGKEVTTQNGKFFKIELDFSSLFDLVKHGGELNNLLRTWTDKTGKDHKTIRLVFAELQEQNKTEYRTHSLKVDTWKPTHKAHPPKVTYDPVTPEDDLPF